jgi:integrase
MARAARHGALETRSGRDRLGYQKEPHWAKVRKGLFVGYYKGERTRTWWARLYEGGGRYTKHEIGAADDHQDANGVDVFSFYQAQDKAREWAERSVLTTRGRVEHFGPMTVAQAAKRYLEWFEVERKSTYTTRRTIESFIDQSLGPVDLSDLTRDRIKRWRDEIAKQPPRKRPKAGARQPEYRKLDPEDADAVRRRRASTNRILTVLKAILNRAFEDGLVKSDAPWRAVKPYKRVDEPRIRIPTEDECRRLINAATPELRRLVKATLFTAGRFGNLSKLRVADVDVEKGRVFFADTKGGRPLHVPLSAAGRSFFAEVTAAKADDALAVVKDDGAAWGKNHYVRALADANESAKIAPPITLTDLRHGYASALINAGVPIEVISKLMGHADVRITMRHYAHLVPSTLEAAVDQLPTFGHKPGKVKRIGGRHA